MMLPGTTLSVAALPEKGAFEALRPIFDVCGGLSLSQVAELSGLNATTIQNWVKRGWVESPVNKKYGAGQVARILILHLLRSTMQFDHILTLMTYLNGRVDDRSDDILPDEELYSLICGLLVALEEKPEMSADAAQTLVKERLAKFAGKTPEERDKLTRALELILLNIRASYLMRQAQALYADIVPPSAAE